MSWFLGIIKSDNQVNIPDHYKNIHDEALFILSQPNIYLALGGINETCLYEFDEKTQSGWVAAGLGIRLDESGAKFLTKDDWRNLLSYKSAPSLSELDGHFIAFRWKGNEIEFFTDQLGLRTGYYAKCKDGYCFSSRVDWLAKLTNQNEINTTFLGTRWLLFNQLSYESPLTGIDRFGPSGHILIKNDNVLKSEYKLWLPEFDNQKGSSEAKKILKSLIYVENQTNKMSLALSGGLDSRTILGFLLAGPDSSFSIHSFGEPNDPDVLVSDDISQAFGLQRKYFKVDIPGPDVLLSLAESFTAQNLLVEPCSSILKLRHYSDLYLSNHYIIDGGSGEIARRQFLNRIVKAGRRYLQEMQIPKLFRLLRVHRAEIFNPEYRIKIEHDALKNLEEVLNIMPSPAKIGTENFVDLLSVRSRVPNFGGPEQARSDSYVVNFMPMVQPSFLKSIFRLDVDQRKNGKIFREIIQVNAPELKNFPLVKSGMTYPFNLNNMESWIYVKIKSKVKKPYTDTTVDEFLKQLSGYVQDLVHSIEFKNCKLYDHKKIVTYADAYYKNQSNYRDYIIWWLTFELWKRSISKKKKI